MCSSPDPFVQARFVRAPFAPEFIAGSLASHAVWYRRHVAGPSEQLLLLQRTPCEHRSLQYLTASAQMATAFIGSEQSRGRIADGSRQCLHREQAGGVAGGDGTPAAARIGVVKDSRNNAAGVP